MATILLSDTAGSITVFLERVDGSPATGLVSSDLQAGIKKATSSSFSTKSLVDPASATAEIGAGADGTVTIEVDAAGEGGNDWTVEVEVPGGTSALSVDVTGTDILVSLAVSGGVPVGGSNTAALVAAAITAELGVTATASGTGATPLTAAEGPTDFTGGVDGNWFELNLGYYQLDFTAAETNVLGNLYVRLVGPTIKSALFNAFVTEEAPEPDVVQPPPLSSLFGYIFSPSGDPVVNAAISARILSIPTILQPAAEGMAISTALVTSKSDDSGFFSLALVAGAVVDVNIPQAGFRRTLTVPTSSANLFSIP